jgi:transcriptional regulator with PAS, ATPase and Fis domain
MSKASPTIERIPAKPLESHLIKFARALSTISLPYPLYQRLIPFQPKSVRLSPESSYAVPIAMFDEDSRTSLTLISVFPHMLEDQIFRGDEPDHQANTDSRTHHVFPAGYVEGCSPSTGLLHREVESFSKGSFPVLILGETGVGKEHTAQLLHLWSERSESPFVAVNCMAIPHDLWESEMFGIGKGIATGVQEREGYFLQAQGGTIFLDEIGELPLALQAKLLRVLQDQIVPRVGGAQVQVNVRVIAATNIDLLGRVDEGSFRADLYYRISGVLLRVPPLREHSEDIPDLVQHFLEKHTEEARKTVHGLTLEVWDLLCEYAWPGNVRELENEICRLVYLCPEGQMIDATLLPGRIRQDNLITSQAGSDFANSMNLNFRLSELEARLIHQALTKAMGNRTLAAKLLGTTRNGLAMKMARLGIQLR